MKNNPKEKLLMEELTKKQKMGIHEITEFLGISQATARRLATKLENDGKLMRTHGGVRITERALLDYRFEDLTNKQIDEKMRIGEYAASTVESGDAIYLDSGTTLTFMAYALLKRINNGEITDIDIFTNSLAILKILEKHCNINLIGGLYREKRQDFCGYLTEKMLRQIRFNKGYLGADGIDKEYIMATDVETARIGELAVSHSEKVYLLADSTKFFKKSFMSYSPIEAPYEYITDTDATVEILMYFSQKEINITSV